MADAVIAKARELEIPVADLWLDEREDDLRRAIDAAHLFAEPLTPRLLDAVRLVLRVRTLQTS